MWSFRTTVRRALDRARRLPAGLGRRGRRPLALGAAATLLVSAFGLPAPAGVAAQPAEPAARLQVVVKQVTIHDDREGVLSGQGEMRLFVRIGRCPEGIAPPCPDQRDAIAGAFDTFSAGKGDTVTRDRVVPQLGDDMWGEDTAPELGFAVSAGYQHVVVFEMDERDGFALDPDDMGDVIHVLDTGQHGLGLGTHTRPSGLNDRGFPGDYTITYEIRPAPLPDLQALRQITIQALPGSAEKRVCMVVHNRGGVHAGPFEVALRVDGVVPPDGRATAAGLAPGHNHMACVETDLPDSGQHRLAAVVDAPRALIEFDETNNAYEEPYAPAPPTPGPAQPDLTVSAIRVNGRAPDGKDDCKDGRNDVAVVIKNAGAAHATSLAVRLDVDGQERDEALLSGLVAGQEQEVRFEDVRLRKGAHTLTAIADPTSAVAETKEDNNELTVTARCTDHD